MRITSTILSVLVLLLLAGGCGQEQKNSKSAADGSGMRYARSFSMESTANFSLLRVFDPWQHSQGMSYNYVLSENPDQIPDSLSALPAIRVPVERVLCMSTTHVAMIAALDRVESIVGLSGSEFIYNQDVRKEIESGRVRDLGYGQGLDYESIVELQPDVLFIYGVDAGVSSTVAKLEELDIPVVYCADYLEQTPLDRAEWIRFFAAFYGEEELARQTMDSIAHRYGELCSLVNPLEERPAVLSGLPWKDVWYMAGGRSYAARLIADAGGRYLWEEDPSHEALPLNLESVYARAVEADIWINPGVARSMKELREFDMRFEALPPLVSGRVYNNDSRMSPGGGNDYWESAIVRPDLVLEDLIAIFHPSLLPDHTPTYYRKLK